MATAAAITTTSHDALVRILTRKKNHQHNRTKTVFIIERTNARFDYAEFLSNHRQPAQEAGHFLL
jgi:hypothetical protein